MPVHHFFMVEYLLDEIYCWYFKTYDKKYKKSVLKIFFIQKKSCKS